MELCDNRIRIRGPGVHFVRALAGQHVVVTLATVENVVITRVAVPAVAEETIVPAEAEHCVTATAAIEPVAGDRAIERVIARAAIQHTNPVGATRGQGGSIHRIRADRETERVVSAEAGNPELLDERFAGGRILPGAERYRRRSQPSDIHTQLRRRDLIECETKAQHPGIQRRDPKAGASAEAVGSECQLITVLH